MSGIQDTSEWREFFKCYKNSPILWKTNLKPAPNRKTKFPALQSLLKIYKSMDPTANICTVEKRLMHIRSCYRRELKKVIHNKKLGLNYSPTLWYFNYLKFLEYRDGSVAPQLTNDEDEESCDDVSDTDDTLHNSSNNMKIFSQPLPEITTRRDPVEQAKLTCVELNDDLRAYAESWATSYRKLSNTQKLYAKRAIEEVLVFGQLELLTINTVKTPSNTVRQPKRKMPLTLLNDEKINSLEVKMGSKEEVLWDDLMLET